MSILDAIAQGLIQGLTEFLPVSSSGHLSIFQYFTGQSGEQGLLFTVLLHFGTLVAVFAAFYKTIWELIIEFFHMLGDIFTGKFSFKNPNPKRRMIFMLILAELPLFLVLLVQDIPKGLASDNSILFEGFALIITGILLYFADRSIGGRKKAKDMKTGDALAVGFAQGIATLPGISRSGSTLSVGLLCGLDRSYAVAFSFILGIPAVLAANVLELSDALKAGESINMLPTVIGVIVAAISGFLAIKMVSFLVKTEKLKIFSWYTLIVGSVVIIAAITEIFTNGAIRTFITSLIA